MAAYRLVFFVPYVLPMVATGIIWRWMYNQRGVVNQGLALVGLDRFTRAWLGDFDFALIAVGLIGSWTLSGFCMMLFIAGAQRIDDSLYDAARIDGAGAYWQFRAVTLPGLRREISVALVVTTIAALGTFDVVYVTTDGGPVNSTVVPSLLVYRLAFREQKIGEAAALSMILTVLIVAMVAGVRWLTQGPHDVKEHAAADGRHPRAARDAVDHLPAPDRQRRHRRAARVGDVRARLQLARDVALGQLRHRVERRRPEPALPGECDHRRRRRPARPCCSQRWPATGSRCCGRRAVGRCAACS